MFEDYIINSAVGALLLMLQDSSKRSKWRKAMLKVFRAIAVAFGNDPDFRLVGREVTK